MRRHLLVVLLAVLVSFPLAQAIQSCIAALSTPGHVQRAAVVADVLMATLSLGCSLAVLVLTDEPQRRVRLIPLLDWRAITRVRRRTRSRVVDPAHARP